MPHSQSVLLSSPVDERSDVELRKFTLLQSGRSRFIRLIDGLMLLVVLAKKMVVWRAAFTIRGAYFALRLALFARGLASMTRRLRCLSQNIATLCSR